MTLVHVQKTCFPIQLPVGAQSNSVISALALFITFHCPYLKLIWHLPPESSVCSRLAGSLGSWLDLQHCRGPSGHFLALPRIFLFFVFFSLSKRKFSLTAVTLQLCVNSQRNAGFNPISLHMLKQWRVISSYPQILKHAQICQMQLSWPSVILD